MASFAKTAIWKMASLPNDKPLLRGDALGQGELERFKLICGQFVVEDGPWSGWNGRLARPGRQLADRSFHRQNRYGYSILLT
ncbi:MAG TPA: hypothetical protein VN765_06820, partial [Candidatus Acidoferrum sp.]|nr:hypothetical protein [Candidatus Acidoferrum sp.]